MAANGVLPELAGLDSVLEGNGVLNSLDAILPSTNIGGKFQEGLNKMRGINLDFLNTASKQGIESIKIGGTGLSGRQIS